MVSKRMTFRVIKIIIPCVEGDKSYCQPRGGGGGGTQP